MTVADRSEAALRASVIVVTYDSRDVIGACLDALQMTIGPTDEVIVVDNESRDGTAEVVATYGPSTRLVRSGANLGFAGGCNLGARLARGRYLIFLNPDTEPRPGWIESLLSALTAVHDAGLVSPKLLLTRAPDRVASLGVNVHLTGIPTSRGWGQPASRYSSLDEVGAISGACFAVTRDVFFAVGAFDERLFLYCEDLELSVRCRMAGYRCYAAAASEVLHVHRPGMWATKLYYTERNRWWMILKLCRLRTLIGLVPALVLSEFVVWTFAVLSGPAHVAAKARAWATILSWMPGLPEARRSASRLRAVSDRDLLRIHLTRLPFSQVEWGVPGRLAEAVTAVLFAASRFVAEVLSE